MRRVARNEYAACLIAGGNAHVHAVRPRLADVVTLVALDDILQAALQRVRLHLFLNGQMVFGINRYTPATRHFQQAEIAIVFPAIGDVRQALQMVFKWKCRRHEKRCFRVGLALKFDPGGFPQHAARAITSHGIKRADTFRCPRHINLNGDTVCVAHDIGDRLAVADLDAWLAQNFVAQGPRQFPLLTLQAIGMSRVPCQHGQIKNSALAAWMQADLPMRTDQAFIDQSLRDAEGLQHLERGRMKRRGAQILIDRCLRLNDTHAHIAGT